MGEEACGGRLSYSGGGLCVSGLSGPSSLLVRIFLATGGLNKGLSSKGVFLGAPEAKTGQACGLWQGLILIKHDPAAKASGHEPYSTIRLFEIFLNRKRRLQCIRSTRDFLKRPFFLHSWRERPNDDSRTNRSGARRLGLNKPIYIQYGVWLIRLLNLDLGKSVMTKRSVIVEIAKSFPATLIMTISALLVTLLVSLPMSVLSAIYMGSLLDKFTNSLAMLGTSIPGFYWGLILIDIFAGRLRLFPAMGARSAVHLILPCLTIGVS